MTANKRPTKKKTRCQFGISGGESRQCAEAATQVKSIGRVEIFMCKKHMTATTTIGCNTKTSGEIRSDA